MKQFFQLSGALVLLGSSMFAGTNFGFLCIDQTGPSYGNSGNCNVVQTNFNVEVSANGATGVDFKFTNNVAIASSITDIYFDYPTGLFTGVTGITDSGAGVAFSSGASPSNLPGGGDPGVNFTSDASADSDAPVSDNGVNTASEWVTITLGLGSGKTLADALAALNNSSFRIGLHVQAIGTGGNSDAFITTPNPPERVVPEPSTYAVLAGSIGALVYARRRRQASKA